MVAELKALAAQLGRRPTLIEYLAETRYELFDVYKSSIGGWYSLLCEGKFLSEPPLEADILLTKRFQLLLHVDSIRRLRFYQDQLSKEQVGLRRSRIWNGEWSKCLLFDYSRARRGSQVPLGTRD